MALTNSSMQFPLGTVAPNFQLFDTISGKFQSLKTLKSDVGTVIMFICNHCPFVQHLQQAMVDAAQKYQAQGICFIAINSNDVSQFPEDAPEKMRQTALEFDYPFPYLFDETQAVAKQYNAVCTPDFFVFDGKMHCTYRGRFDASTPSNHQPIDGKDLDLALHHLLNALPPIAAEKQLPSIGCNIKWKQT